MAASSNKKSSVKEKKRNKRINKINGGSVSFIGIVLIAIVVYIIFSLISGYVSKLTTETAQLVTVSDNISTVGIAIRDETVITSDVSGVNVSVVENGSKVYKGETIVNVFSSEQSAQAYMRINEIDDALTEFENMSTAGEDNAAELSSIEKQLDNRLFSFSSELLSGSLEEAMDISEDILYLLNKSQIATKQVDNFDVRVNELKAEMDGLKKKYSESPQNLCSPLSGYYISEVDGYEGLLRTDILEELTVENVDKILEEPVENYNSSVIGKIADDYIWYIVCNVTAEEAEDMSINRSYTIFLPYSEIESVDASLVNKKESTDGEKVMLVFKCTYMVSALASFRSQPIIIQKKSFTGLGISLSALATIEETNEVSSSDGFVLEETKQIPGVYILWGNEVKFRRIKELYRDGNMIVCELPSESGMLKMYDEVIINKENLYDGKIVNSK